MQGTNSSLLCDNNAPVLFQDKDNANDSALDMLVDKVAREELPTHIKLDVWAANLTICQLQDQIKGLQEEAKEWSSKMSASTEAQVARLPHDVSVISLLYVSY